jgi:hypothetical protein
MAGKAVVATAVLALASLGTTWTLASFTAARTVGGSTFTAGTVSVTDNDAGSALLAMSVAKPGDIATSCMRVTYTGTGAARIRLYGTTGGTGLDGYLTLVVTRGTNTSGTFGNCGGFTPDTTNHIGHGNGVIYNGTLAGFADSSVAATMDPSAGSPETWTNGESHDFRFFVSLGNSDAAQGKTATQSFTWEATSL